jgi:O-antigen/teichoic acid export membrane protein
MNIPLLERARSYRLKGTLRTAARNTTVTMIGRVVSVAATAGFTALFSRHVGVAGFGQYAYALSLATLLGGLSGFGLDTWAIRELVRRPNDAANVVGRSLGLQAVLGTLCLGGLAFYFSFIHRDAILLVVSLIVGAYTFLDVSGILVISVFRAREVMVYETVAIIAGNLALLLFTVIGIALHLGIRGILALIALSFVLKFSVIVWSAKRHCGLGRLLPALRPSAQSIRAGFPFFMTSVGNTVYASYPRLMLAAFVTLPVVGLYAAAERAIALVAILPGILDIVIYPIFARRVEHSREAFAQTYQQVSEFTLVMGLVMGLGVAAILPEMIRVLFGARYAGALPIAMLLVPGVTMATQGYVYTRALLALQGEKLMSMIIAATAVAGIAMSSFFARAFGASGMAVTVLITSAAGYVFYFVYIRRRLALPAMAPRHIVFFAVFPLTFSIAFVMKDSRFVERMAVDGAMLLALLVVLRAIGMLDWLSVFKMHDGGPDATEPLVRPT